MSPQMLFTFPIIPTNLCGLSDLQMIYHTNSLITYLASLINSRLHDELYPSLQVELAEAQLNYLIGQTDILLENIDESGEWINWHARGSAVTSSSPNNEEYLIRYRYFMN